MERVELSQGGDLISAIPHLLGFHPADGVVITCWTRTEHGARLGLSMRLDLPVPAALDVMIEACVAAVLRQRDLGGVTVDGVMIVIVGGGPESPTELPERVLVDGLRRAFDTVGVEVLHACWTPHTCGGQSWRCYEDPDCGGVAPESGSSQLAAATVRQGLVTYVSREEVVAQLTGVDPAGLARRGQRLQGPFTPRTPAEGYAVVVDAIDAAEGGRLPTTDEEFVALAECLADPLVRDLAVFAMVDNAACAEQVWRELVRGLPAPARALPASLLAVAGYLRGDGAVANIAATLALDADPSNTLAALIKTVLGAAVPPTVIQGIAIDAGWAALRELQALG